MLELGGILILGIFAQWAAWKVKIPAILPLIIIGLFVGPIAELAWGSKWIDPELMFQGKTMFYFVSLSVGVILFEGGLTLKFKEVRELAGTVTNMIFIGSVIMTLGAAAAAWLLFDMDFRLALLFGSLMIVTGPTVIAPILKSVKPNKNVTTILKWEGILIDPVGAFVAVMIYELFFVATMGIGGEGNITFLALQTFFTIVFVGATVGLVLGGILYWILKKDLIPDSLLEVISLAFVVLAFAGADQLVHESGLLAVTVMGVLLANLETPKIKKIIHFKENITVLLISILFIILSAKITAKNIIDLQALIVPVVIIFAIISFVLRPIVVFLSSRKSNLNFKEKIFISWIGPKGIVAAAVAALFALYLTDGEHIRLPDYMAPQVELLVPLTFAIILGTVTLNGLLAKPVAKALDVMKNDAKGFLIAGANSVGILLAKYLSNQGVSVLLIDTSERNVRNAREMGLRAIRENIMSEDVDDFLETEDVGNLISVTSAHDVNIFACTKFKEVFGEGHVFRLITPNEADLNKADRPKSVLFDVRADYARLATMARRYNTIQEHKIESDEQLKLMLSDNEDKIMPLMIIKGEDVIMLSAQTNVTFEEGDILAYIGELPSSIQEKEQKVTNGEG